MEKKEKIKSTFKEKLQNVFKTEKPISNLQIFLTIIFVVALLVSNIISARIFNFFGFSMTSAVIIFPITYILSDLFSEVYGYKWSRITCYLGFTINLLTVGIFYLVSILPVFEWSASAAASFNSVMIGTFACTIASFIAYVVGDFANDKVFAKMKSKHQGLTNNKGFALRAILSSAIGEFFDSAIYLPLAFLVFNPIMSVSQVLIMIGLQVVLKTGYEAIVLPLNMLCTKKAAQYEAKFQSRFVEIDKLGADTAIVHIDTSKEVKEENIEDEKNSNIE